MTEIENLTNAIKSSDKLTNSRPETAEFVKQIANWLRELKLIKISYLNVTNTVSQTNYINQGFGSDGGMVTESFLQNKIIN